MKMGEKSDVFWTALMVTLMISAVNAQCPQLQQCFKTKSNRHCRWEGIVATCVADLKDVCPLKEEGITFEEVKNLSSQFCEEIWNNILQVRKCQSVAECLQKSDIGLRIRDHKLNLTLATQDSILLRSQTWCQFLDVTASCILANADTCHFESSFLSFMTHQHKDLSAVCPASTGDVTDQVTDIQCSPTTLQHSKPENSVSVQWDISTPISTAMGGKKTAGFFITILLWAVFFTGTLSSP